MSADVEADVDADGCDRCGDALAGAGFSLELEYPPDSEADPGRFALQVCADCADAIASQVLVGRAIDRGVAIYEGVDGGRTRGETR